MQIVKTMRIQPLACTWSHWIISRRSVHLISSPMVCTSAVTTVYLLFLFDMLSVVNPSISAVWSGECVCHTVCKHRPRLPLSPLSSSLQRHRAVWSRTERGPENQAGTCYRSYNILFLLYDVLFSLRSPMLVFVVGVWAIQSLQRQHTHLPQVCSVCIPGSGVRGSLQVRVRCRVRRRRLPVWRRLWSGRLAQRQINLQAECNLSLSKGWIIT